MARGAPLRPLVNAIGGHTAGGEEGPVMTGVLYAVARFCTRHRFVVLAVWLLAVQIEEHVHAGEDNKSSVVSGLITSARVITAAAMIMVFVKFGSFVLNGDPTVKQFGIGLGVAVILDATIVRCLLVAALMVKMGTTNWYMPGRLERLLPHISIEGAEFFEKREQRRAIDRVRDPEPVQA
jgi:putative drug exporter of the RND superfamily